MPIFLLHSPLQEPTQSHLLKTKDFPIIQEIPKDLGGQLRNQGQRPNIRRKNVLSTLTTKKIPRCRGVLCQLSVQKPVHTYILPISHTYIDKHPQCLHHKGQKPRYSQRSELELLLVQAGLLHMGTHILCCTTEVKWCPLELCRDFIPNNTCGFPSIDTVQRPPCILGFAIKITHTLLS